MADEDLGTTELDEIAASPKKKGGGLPLVPIIIVVVLLGVVGAVGYFVVMPMLAGGGEEAEEANGGQPAGKQATVVQASSEGVYDPENKPGLIEFNDPILVKLRKVQGAGLLEPDSYLQFTISLEVATPEIQEEMEGDPVVIARLKDTINTFFGKQLPDRIDVLNWSLIKQQLKDEINSMFPPQYHVKRVNFTKFLVQSK